MSPLVWDGAGQVCVAVGWAARSSWTVTVTASPGGLCFASCSCPLGRDQVTRDCEHARRAYLELEAAGLVERLGRVWHRVGPVPAAPGPEEVAELVAGWQGRATGKCAEGRP